VKRDRIWCYALFEDITERKLAEDALARSEADAARVRGALPHLAQALPVLVWAPTRTVVGLSNQRGSTTPGRAWTRRSGWVD
jgi:PAS domain-containing protein